MTDDGPSAWFRTGIAGSRTSSRAIDGRAGSREHGVTVRVPGAEAKAAGLGGAGVATRRVRRRASISSISLGGDGTMLHAVDLVYPAPVPILGVNVGQLGYLTEVEPDELDASLPRLLAGDFDVSERMVLAVHVMSSGAAAGTWFALNEAAFEKQRSGHLIRLDVSINGSPFTTYAADGVIVATPDGHHRVLVLGARPDRVARVAVPGAHAGVAAHAVRSFARARRQRRARVRGVRRPGGRADRSMVASWVSSARGIECRASRPPSRSGSRACGPVTSTRC